MLITFVLTLLLCYSLASPTNVGNNEKVRYSRKVDNPCLERHGYIAVQVNYDKVFLVSTQKQVNYFDAFAVCGAFGLKLIEVDSPAKHEIIKDVVKNYTKSGPFWMDGTRLENREVWRWGNGTPIDRFYWDRGEPNNSSGTEMCIVIYHMDALWDDKNCMEKIYFICENSRK